MFDISFVSNPLVSQTPMGVSILEFIRNVVSILAPVLSGYLGIKYGIKHIKEQKKLDLIEEQLKNFYSPILGLHKEILAKSELRLKLQQASNQAWQEKADRATGKDHSYIMQEIEYDNNQFKEVLLPLYNKMLEIFRDQYWLAEAETKEYYSGLVEFVEIWNRHLSGGIDPEAIKKIGHSEEKLNPFYQELEDRIEILRKKLLDK